MLLSYADIIRNALKSFVERRHRYGIFSTIHITDVIGCPVRAYLERTIAVTPSLNSLVDMTKGILWEKIIAPLLVERKRAIRPELKAYAKFRGIEGEFVIVGHPDGLTRTDVIEIKTTDYPINTVYEIVGRTERNIAQVLRVFPEFPAPNVKIEYHREEVRGRSQIKAELPLFRNWIAQVSIYNNMLAPVYRSKLVVIYDDEVREFDVTRDFYTKARRDFLNMLPVTAFALFQARKVGYSIEAQKEIMRFTMRYCYPYAYIGCERCQYHRIGICVGLIPLRWFSISTLPNPNVNIGRKEQDTPPWEWGGCDRTAWFIISWSRYLAKTGVQVPWLTRDNYVDWRRLWEFVASELNVAPPDNPYNANSVKSHFYDQGRFGVGSILGVIIRWVVRNFGEPRSQLPIIEKLEWVRKTYDELLREMEQEIEERARILKVLRGEL